MNKTLRNYAIMFKEGILDNNPILIQLLGICPTLATTTSVTNALGMGIATTAVLVFSNMFISLLRKFIPDEVRIAAYVVVISGFVSAVEMLIKAYFPALDKSLGVFIPLIVVNCIILARAESYASKNKVLPSIMDGLSMGIGFAVALLVISSIREILGAGTWFGIDLFGPSYQPVLLFIMPSGAFITLGCLMALMKKLISFRKPEKEIDNIIELVKTEEVAEPVIEEVVAEEEPVVEETIIEPEPEIEVVEEKAEEPEPEVKEIEEIIAEAEGEKTEENVD